MEENWEEWEQLPLFGEDSDWRPAQTSGDQIGPRLTELAIEHILVIDLIDLTMQIVPDPEHAGSRMAQWRKTANMLLENSTPVVVFLARALADLLVQLGVDRERVLTQLRQAASERIDKTEQFLNRQGHRT